MNLPDATQSDYLRPLILTSHERTDVHKSRLDLKRRRIIHAVSMDDVCGLESRRMCAKTRFPRPFPTSKLSPFRGSIRL